MNEEKYIGYLRYAGESIDDGLLDIKKSAEALMGFDEILRYFLVKEDPELKEMQFEIPVRIKKGSWEALIPDVFDKLFSPDGMIFTGGAAYVVALGNAAAKDGFLETGPVKDMKKVFKAAIQSAQAVIKIASHVGTLSKKKLEHLRINTNGGEPVIEIPNSAGEILKAPKKYFDLYTGCPEKLFSKNAGLIQRGRTFNLGVFNDLEKTEVTITEEQKYIFYKEPDSGVLFPEFEHGQYIELEGGITRGNERTNTIGFEYMGHVLTCRPKEGNIAIYKEKIISQEDDHFFPPVRIQGVIDRKDKEGGFKEKRPTIVFNDIIPLEAEDQRQGLF